MKNINLNKIKIGLLSLVWVILDILTKNLVEKKSYIITDFFHLRFAREYPKFDLIPQLSPYSMQIAIFGSILSLIIMGYFYLQYYNRIILFSITMIIAGIIGNLIDKIYFGWSRVFIDFHHPKLLILFNTSQFPLFNLADILICWGTLIFIFNKKW
jgi:lipoprotein signal peptidase